MSERGRSADPRAERVRSRLRQAALFLADERPVDEISVGDLVSQADVSRQVFYRHFRDRDDAIAAAFSHLFCKRPAQAEDAKARILELFGFAAEHAALFRHVVPSTVNQYVLVTYRDALRAPCEQIASQGMAVLDTITSISADAVTRFLVGGFTEVLRSWMEDPDATDLSLRIGAALDTVDALLGITSAQKGPSRG
ncbi:TetR/AcrR family transcriptional regulator [Mycolicibacterium iranicum]|uniref:TetR/AcrR family transcriptional regulator n=1 Tax=Mycolicibacterium iranicum TaxID=912594 RepID=UPI00046412AB|nr:TetR/AcrR family transcriptional regulator [Mycolicibacterium iranicum]